MSEQQASVPSVEVQPEKSCVGNVIIAILIVFVILWILHKNNCKPANDTEYETTRSGMQDISSYGTGVRSREFEKRMEDAVGDEGQDHMEAIQKIALGKDVFDSHGEYVRGLSYGGAPQFVSERSDAGDQVPWSVRRPDVHAIPVRDPTTTMSAYIDQIDRPKRYAY